MIRKEAVIALLGSPIAYYTAFARVLGGVEAGILTSQFFYWYGKGHNPDGWIYKTQAEIEEETGLSRRNQETARKKLRELGVLEEDYAGMPAKLYYRLNLDRLFALVNEWFSEEVIAQDADQHETEENTPVDFQDVRIRHPRKREPAIQGSANPPSKDVRTRHPRKREPAIQGSANPPFMDGGLRHSNTKNTTKTTTENTTETTTTTGPTMASTDTSVVVSVAVESATIPVWIVEEFKLLLGSNRTVNAVDQAALGELGTYPEHVVHQALEAARAWLRKSNQKPIHSLGRWLVGTAQRKWEAELTRGSAVSSITDESTYIWNVGVPEGEAQGSIKPIESSAPKLRTPQEQVWDTVLQELALQMPKATYDAWLIDTTVVAATEDAYEIGLPNAQAKDWIENRLAHTIKRTLASILGHSVAIRFHILP